MTDKEILIQIIEGKHSQMVMRHSVVTPELAESFAEKLLEEIIYPFFEISAKVAEKALVDSEQLAFPI